MVLALKRGKTVEVTEGLGDKRLCPNCGAKFYDLGAVPCVCVKCEHEFEPEVLLKSKRRPTEEEIKAAEKAKEEAKEKAAAAAKEKASELDDSADDVELVAIDDLEDNDDESDDDGTLIDLDDDDADVSVIIEADIPSTKDDA